MRSQVLTLLKTDVDWTGGWLQLRDSRNREPRRFPLDCLGLRGIFEQQMERPPLHALHLFHRFGGKKIMDVRGSWRNACAVAGLKNLMHDFRRSSVRNLCNAGVDQTTAMLLTGHRTAEVFRRYRIVNEADLRSAGAKLTSSMSSKPQAYTTR